eukprot:5172155-Pyramimonas_sp.AAC.1
MTSPLSGAYPDGDDSAWCAPKAYKPWGIHQRACTACLYIPRWSHIGRIPNTMPGRSAWR